MKIKIKMVNGDDCEILDYSGTLIDLAKQMNRQNIIVFGNIIMPVNSIVYISELK